MSQPEERTDPWEKRVRYCFLFVSVLLVSSPCTVWATVVRPVSANALAQQTNAVVHGRVSERWIVPKRGPKGEIYTRTRLEVIEYFRGDGPHEVVVQQLGGQLNGFTMSVVGSPALDIDDEVVLFLNTDSEHGLSYIVGMAQGVYFVETDGAEPWVYQDLSGLSFYTRSPQLVTPKMGGLDHSLEKLRLKVSGLRVMTTIKPTALKVKP